MKVVLFCFKLTLCHNFLAAKRRNPTSGSPGRPALGAGHGPVITLHYFSSNLLEGEKRLLLFSTVDMILAQSSA